MIYITGIKPTGTPHFGNYLSAIKPLIELSQDPNNTIYLFIADGHSLTTHPKSKELQHNILSVSATCISLLNSSNVFIYKQSDIPEIFELFWILSCFTAKGHLNRCHAYHSLTQENLSKNKDEDKGIFTGLFNYPVLMAADILSVFPDVVPVGPDQKQHMEITKEVVRKLNHVYKSNLKIPNDYYLLKDDVPGVDNRKMSKSYNNTIPLFEGNLKKKIYSYITNSKLKGEVKYRNDSPLIKFFEMVIDDDYLHHLLYNMLERGENWGDIKSFIYFHVNEETKENRKYYNHLMENQMNITQRLRNDGEKVRNIVKENLHTIKKIVGLA